ncbi:MAG: sugar ABC transporter permease [Treponema sp.]|jgi:ABC-type sugar transport system permease subunit|nr:sugar ABC transporter permease [Treponema sp.]
MKERIRQKTAAIPWIGRDSSQAVLMLLPMLIGFIVFTYIPILYIVRFAFYNYTGFRGSFNGIENFIRVFQRDRAFWGSFLNTLILSAGKLAVEIPLAIFLAVLLHRGAMGTAFFRVTLFLPTIISTAIVGLVFSLMFASYEGVINTILQNAGFIAVPIDWLGKKWTALLVIAMASIWANIGINMIFFLMALQGVPRELYECATLDGCPSLKVFFRITLPMIAPIFRVVLLNAIIGSLKMTDLVLASTNGQPGGTTEVVMTYVFKFFMGYSTRRVEVGYACAMTLVTGVFLGAITYLYLRASKKMNME